jgi:uncharacterized protein (TIGR00296 family)
LKKVGLKNNLRGCIGFPYPIKSLVNAIVESAQSAALRDIRFPPVSIDEMDEIILEVSVLTPPFEIQVEDATKIPENIKIGTDGLIISNGILSGLLLPQVAIEWNWDSEEFLCHCCQKAGLPPDAWLNPVIKVMKFRSIIFQEESPRGTIQRLLLKG